jgi:acyl transferase domain-containing protein/acyl carrier protein
MASMPAESTFTDFLERIQKLSPRRLALLAAELERRLAAQEESAPDLIAVTGVGLRMPGGIDTVDAFWDLLYSGGDAIQDIPSSRWDAEAFYAPFPGTPGKANTKWGGFVSHIDEFDAAFFGIAPKEAIGMDPQQRMLLEVSWEALENAGERAELLNGSLTGVFVGMSTNDYASLLDMNSVNGLDAYSGSGIARSVAAGRLSYFLGLKGPNISIDTACSSSAVAIHLACQSLRHNECRVALAGGVNALLAPHVTITLAQARMLASDGRCKSFSQSADGFVRSEGCGMLVLKRLADAEADRDRILGVIRASAINHDGRSSGLTAPNGPSQEAVMKAALKQARLSPGDVDYIEAHGTGTVLGDAIELGALGGCFGKDDHAREKLLIGSVKTNIGHLEAAAGVAGVIKVLLALQNRSLPAHLHVSDGHENDALRQLPLKIPLSATPWPVTERPRVAGVSSFGFSGTNAHIVIEESPVAQTEGDDFVPSEVITVSAKSTEALSALCGRYADYLQQHPQTSLADFAFSLNAGRSHFQHRIAILASSTKEASDQLQQIAGLRVQDHAGYRFIAGYEEPSIGFLFTGQGSQYPGMGRALYIQNTVFRSAIDYCDDILKGKLAYKLSDVLCGENTVPSDLIHETNWTQPALFAFEYALALMWLSWGVRPSVVLGHSLGEYVAACIAQVFSVESALALAYERGRLMATLPRGGMMLAVRAGEEEVAEIIRDFNQVNIAAVNASRNVVVSGTSTQIERLRSLLAERGVVAQPLTVSHAFHSVLMEPILDEFEQSAAKLTYNAPAVPLISNVSGQLHTSQERLDASYWRKHIRSTVRFSEGFGSLMEQRPAALLEVGPDPVLLGMAKPALVHSSVLCCASLRRGKDSWVNLYETVRQFYLLGVPIEWNRIYEDRSVRKLALPTYPFQRQRYWIKSAKNGSTPVREPVVAQSFDPLLYTTEWRPQPNSARAFKSTTPQDLLSAATQAIDAMSNDGEVHKTIAAYGNFLPQLDGLCTTYILEAMDELGVNLREGARLSLVDVYGKLGVRPEHRRLIKRLCAILEEDGIIHRDGGGWVFGTIPHRKSAADSARLSAEFPLFTAELNFLGQASNLAKVLQGRMSAVEALFPNGSLELAEQLYQNAPASRMFNRALGEVVRRSVEAYPENQVVRVLEVGAGTGSATSEILPLLNAARVEYIFTDISSAFLGAARNKFAKFPFVRYATLDIEKEIGSESELAEGVDIIVAANVLHATADLTQTLNRLRSTLRHGGTMLISECTALQRFGDLTVGMTEGWWRYTDAPLRQSYPLLHRQQWLDLFSELGLRGAALEEDGPFKALTGRQTILVVQPRATVTPDNAPSVLVLRGSTKSDLLSPALQAAGIVVHQLKATTPVPKNGEAPRTSVMQRLGAEIKPSCILLELADASVNSEIPDLTLQNAVEVLELLQAVTEAEQDRSTIWLVTKAAAAIENDGPIALSSAIADAMARTARLEHPELSIRVVDLPSKPDEKDWIRLGQLIREGTREPSVAIRQGRLMIPRLVALGAVASRDPQPCKLAANAAYLVTGAYGGLGFRTVQWLAERGATRIFMVGRSTPSNEIREQISKLKDRGVRVHDVVADISKRPDLEEIFEQIGESGTELRGIVHAAGVLDDGTLSQQTPEKIANVFAPKVQGAWLLHEISRQHALDFFVLFGSAASVLGSAGQINHGAANAFLEALSHQRRLEGLPSTTVAWGAWSEIGAAARLKNTGRAARLGLGAFSPDKGIDLLEQAIASQRAEVSAMAVDWQIYLESGQTARDWPLFENFLPTTKNESSGVLTDTLNSHLLNAPAENRLDIIKQYLRDRISRVLGLENLAALREDQPLAELGLDSLMALELKNWLQKESGVTLTPNFFFEYRTLDMAAMYLNARLVSASESARAQLGSSEYEELAI